MDVDSYINLLFFFFFQAEDGIRDFCLSRGLGDVYKRQISRFEQVTKITLKNTILILIANLPWTLLVIVILVVSLILAWIIIPLIFILPVGAALTYEFIFERIFRKLMNEEDRLREEEKDKEYRD